MESKKMFYTMGEVSEMFCVSCSLIRYWEKHFNVIKPVRNKKGNRLFTPKDIENFKLIYHLVKERGMTLEGAKKSISAGKLPVSREVELMDRLLSMRSLLEEVRESLKEDGEEFDDELPQRPAQEEEAAAEPEVVTQAEAEPKAEPTPAAPAPSALIEPAPKRDTPPASAEKELFAYYEQNLF